MYAVHPDLSRAITIADSLVYNLHNGAAEPLLGAITFSAASPELPLYQRLIAWSDQAGAQPVQHAAGLSAEAWAALLGLPVTAQDPDRLSRHAMVSEVDTPDPLPGLPYAPIPHLAGLEPTACLAVVTGSIRQTGILVQVSDGWITIDGEPLYPVNGWAHPSARQIQIARGCDPLQQVKTLFHELAHLIFAHRREGEEPDEDAQHELEAEATAFLLMRHLGWSWSGSPRYLQRQCFLLRTEALLVPLPRIDATVADALAIIRVPPIPTADGGSA